MIKITVYYTRIAHKIVNFRDIVLRIPYTMSAPFSQFCANFPNIRQDSLEFCIDLSVLAHFKF